LSTTLQILTGGSSFAHELPPNTFHHYAGQALHEIDQSKTLFDNIESPIHATAEKLAMMEYGFASLSEFKLCGTKAASDGIVFR